MCKPRGVGLLLVSLVLVFMVGCGGYGDISPTAYDYATALYSICNRQAAERLDQVSEQIASAHQGGTLSEREASWLNDVVNDARAGKWKSALRAARQMMEDQVR